MKHIHSIIYSIIYVIKLYNISQIKKICWIFNQKGVDQALISFYSVIKNNPGVSFFFYFVIPWNETLNIYNFSLFLKNNSKIIVRNFPEKYMERHPSEGEVCVHPPLLITKVWLSFILPEVDKILYIDSDMINNAPISQIWDFPMENKTIGGTKRIHLPITWINSGFIFYNLDFLRTQPKDLWKCPNLRSCVPDDGWHTFCHKNESILFFPYRYNVEFYPMRVNMKRTKDQLNEEKNAVFYHLKDISKELYKVTNRSEIKYLYSVRKKKVIQEIFEKIYDMKAFVESKIIQKLN